VIASADPFFPLGVVIAFHVVLDGHDHADDFLAAL